MLLWCLRGLLLAFGLLLVEHDEVQRDRLGRGLLSEAPLGCARTVEGVLAA